jgi:hypothetical protein
MSEAVDAASEIVGVPVERGILEVNPKKAIQANSKRPAVPECFHLKGEYANFISNEHTGEIIKTSVSVTYYEGAERESDYNSHYYSFICRRSPKSHTCLICNTKHSSTDNEISNVVKHIKKAHAEVIPFNFMSSDYISKCVAEWDSANVSGKKRPVQIVNEQGTVVEAPKKAKVQSSIAGVFSRTAADIRQAVLFCLILGYLPLNFVLNPGLRYLLQFFCNGQIPIGLSARSLGRELKDLYDTHITSTAGAHLKKGVRVV